MHRRLSTSEEEEEEHEEEDEKQQSDEEERPAKKSKEKSKKAKNKAPRVSGPTQVSHFTTDQSLLRLHFSFQMDSYLLF